MGYFDIDYDKNVWENLPVDERTPVRFAWLKALIAPVKYIYDLFKTNRGNNLYLLSHNSQVCFMEAMLNDTFDPTLRRILITDPKYLDPVWTYTQGENKPIYIDRDSEIGSGIIPDPDPVPMYLDGEISGSVAMFIINIPHGLPYNANRLQALINLYGLPGRNIYSIVIF